MQGNIGNLFPKYKPNKKIPFSKALKQSKPQLEQTPEKIEQFGLDPNSRYKVKVTLGDGAGPFKSTPLYRFADGVRLEDLDDQAVADLLTTDPKKLKKQGILKGCKSAAILGKDARVFISASVSKVDISPKFSYAFRAQYIIATSLGESNEEAPALQMPDGSVVVPKEVSAQEYEELVRKERKRKRGDSDSPQDESEVESEAESEAEASE